MANEEYVICNKTDLTNIADAVREKNGETQGYSINRLPNAISNLKTPIDNKTIITDADGKLKTAIGGYETVDYNIIWDGNTEGKEYVDISGIPYYLISERTFTTEQLIGCSIEFSSGNSYYNIEESQIHTMVDGLLAIVTDQIIVVTGAPITIEGINFNKNGVYCAIAPTVPVYLTHLFKSQIEKIPDRFINIPTELKNPYALTFTGAVNDSYDGSSGKTVNIPTSLKNPYALTFTGAVTGNYDGSSGKTVNIPTVPTSLKNPYALTITVGDTTVTYDGSSAKSISISDGTEVSY